MNFTEAEEKQSLVSGETLSVLLGKLQKFMLETDTALEALISDEVLEAAEAAGIDLSKDQDKKMQHILLSLLNGLHVYNERFWTYMRLTNGIAICWGIATAKMECKETGMGGYYNASGIHEAFPTGLFVDIPVGIGIAYGEIFATMGQSRPISKDTFYWNVVSKIQGESTYTAHLFAIGRWK